MTKEEQAAQDARIRDMKRRGIPTSERIAILKREMAAEAAARAEPEPPDPVPPVVPDDDSAAEPAAKVDACNATAGSGRAFSGSPQSPPCTDSTTPVAGEDLGANSSKKRAGTKRRKSRTRTVRKDVESMAAAHAKRASDADQETPSVSEPQSGSGLKIVREKTAPDPKPNGKGRDLPTVAPVTVDARGVAVMFSLSVRTVRRLDSSGKIPPGFKIGGRKLWRLRDLRLWSERGFPARREFQDYLRTEAKKTGSRA